MDDLLSWLQRFDRLCASHPGPIPNSIQIGSGQNPWVIGTCVHGVETGSLPGVVQFLENQIQEASPLSWVCILGNRPAALAEKRFVDADLNRQFLFAPDDDLSKWEKKRALEMIVCLKNAGFFLDFHQTNRPVSEPFYIFGYDHNSYLFARALQGAAVLVTRDPKLPFSTGSLCADEYVRHQGTSAVTLELGEKGISDTATHLTLSTLNRLAKLQVDINAPGTVDRNKELERLALQAPELKFVETIHKEAFRDQRLKPDLRNLTWIEKGTLIGTCADGGNLYFPVSGQILFPKYPLRNNEGHLMEPMTGDVFHVVAALKSHPLNEYFNKTFP